MCCTLAAAFVLQSAMGIIIAQWPQTNGGYAAQAHETAMTAGICVQLLALGWFTLPRRANLSATAQMYQLHFPPRPKYLAIRSARYAAIPLRQHERLLVQQAVNWRFAAAASAILCAGLSTALWAVTGSPPKPIQVLAADQSMLSPEWGTAYCHQWPGCPSPPNEPESVSAAGDTRDGVKNTNLRRSSTNSSNEGTWNATRQTDPISTAL